MLDRPLFVTRKFPPVIGGMETLAAGVWRSLHSAAPAARLIANRRGNRWLPLWLPTAAARVLWLVARRRVGYVLCGDALLFAVLSPVLRMARVPHATMVMGLDITYPNSLYQRLIVPILRRAPVVIAISDATAAAARSVGVEPGRVRVLRLGVEVPDLPAGHRAEARRRLHMLLALPDGAVVLATLGRLVQRKGARWFVAEVLPRLPDHVHFVVAGRGDESEHVAAASAVAGVEGRTHLLGLVDDETREGIIRGADVFVQPNVPVHGDMEGFGLVTIEAAVRRTTVVASDLEGLRDAVLDGETGFLVPPLDADAWVSRLEALVLDATSTSAIGEELGAKAEALYGEAAMGAALVQILEDGPQNPPTRGRSLTSP